VATPTSYTNAFGHPATGLGTSQRLGRLRRDTEIVRGIRFSLVSFFLLLLRCLVPRIYLSRPSLSSTVDAHRDRKDVLIGSLVHTTTTALSGVYNYHSTLIRLRFDDRSTAIK